MSRKAHHESHTPAKADAPRPAPTPTRAKRPALPNAEVQALAADARKAFETGTLTERVDSLGGAWTFLQVRDPHLGLKLTRQEPEAEAVERLVSGAELGRSEHVDVLLASTVLALADPA
jgi:hypothetical protein